MAQLVGNGERTEGNINIGQFGNPIYNIYSFLIWPIYYITWWIHNSTHSLAGKWSTQLSTKPDHNFLWCLGRLCFIFCFGFGVILLLLFIVYVRGSNKWSLNNHFLHTFPSAFFFFNKFYLFEWAAIKKYLGGVWII
jgi:hypothetical protein